tara:strand:- start:123 stop:764 length:642 start_codon:yes stop_codon:yes gene_type:complete
MSKTILSLETSSNICGVSIIKGGDILNIMEESCIREHNEKIPEFIKLVFEGCDKTMDNIDAVALSIGPGSFTGLRIGLGFAKGLAYSRGLPIIPIPTLLSLAFSLKEYLPKNGIFYSHSNKVFYQEFDWHNGVPKEISEAETGDIDYYLNNKEIGFQANCKSIIKKDLKIIEAVPSSASIGQLATIFFQDWLINNPYDLVPNYIAPFKLKSSV